MKKSFIMNVLEETDLALSNASFTVRCFGVFGHRAYCNGRMLWEFTPPPRTRTLGEAGLTVVGVRKGDMGRWQEYLRSHDRRARWRSVRPEQEGRQCHGRAGIIPDSLLILTRMPPRLPLPLRRFLRREIQQGSRRTYSAPG